MILMRLKTMLISSVTLFFLFSCSESRAVKAKPEEPEQNVPEDAVAMVGDEPILQKNLEVALEQFPEHRQEGLRMQVLHSLVDSKVFAKEAREAGFDEDPQVQRDIEWGRREILAQSFVLQYIDSAIEPTDKEVKQYYDDHTDQFIVPEGVKVRRIRTVKKEDAEAAMRAIKEGEPFLEVAKQWSKLVRDNERGKIDWLYRKRIAPELEKAFFSVDVGEVSDIVKTGNEYQIVKVLDKSEENLIEFDKVKSKIRLRLVQQKKRKMIHDYYEQTKIDRNPGKGVLVKIGDTSIPEEAVGDILAKAAKRGEREAERIRSRWTRYFVDLFVFSNEARKVGLEKDPEVASKLKQRENHILAKLYRKRVVSDKIEPTEQEILEEYKSHEEEFTEPVTLRVRLIELETKDKAEETLKQMKQGTEFSALAKERSIHPSADKGGELGWFAKGEGRYPRIEEVAKDLEEHEISETFKRDKNYALIKLMGKRGGELTPLEEVRPRIQMELQRRKLSELKKKYYDKWDVKILAKTSPPDTKNHKRGKRTQAVPLDQEKGGRPEEKMDTKE